MTNTVMKFANCDDWFPVNNIAKVFHIFIYLKKIHNYDSLLHYIILCYIILKKIKSCEEFSNAIAWESDIKLDIFLSSDQRNQSQ